MIYIVTSEADFRNDIHRNYVFQGLEGLDLEKEWSLFKPKCHPYVLPEWGHGVQWGHDPQDWHETHFTADYDKNVTAAREKYHARMNEAQEANSAALLRRWKHLTGEEIDEARYKKMIDPVFEAFLCHLVFSFGLMVVVPQEYSF